MLESLLRYIGCKEHPRRLLNLPLSRRRMQRFVCSRLGVHRPPRDRGSFGPHRVPRIHRLCKLCRQITVGNQKHLVFDSSIKLLLSCIAASAPLPHGIVQVARAAELSSSFSGSGLSLCRLVQMVPHAQVVTTQSHCKAAKLRLLAARAVPACSDLLLLPFPSAANAGV